MKEERKNWEEKNEKNGGERTKVERSKRKGKSVRQERTI